MGYRLDWRLVGRANQLLDSGTFDGDYADRPSALEALDSLLLTFPLRDCNEAEGYWRARQSSDADLEIQVSLRKQTCKGKVKAEIWADRRRNQGASLRP
jgi:hypothetical protein